MEGRRIVAWTKVKGSVILSIISILIFTSTFHTLPYSSGIRYTQYARALTAISIHRSPNPAIKMAKGAPRKRNSGNKNTTATDLERIITRVDILRYLSLTAPSPYDSPRLIRKAPLCRGQKTTSGIDIRITFIQLTANNQFRTPKVIECRATRPMNMRRTRRRSINSVIQTT